MEEIKFRVRDGEKEIIKKAKGKMTYRELIFYGVEKIKKDKDHK